MDVSKKMKTRLLIIIIIAAVVASSATTYMIVPVKYTSSFYPEWLRDNMNAAKKLQDSSIPIVGIDVDEKIRVLTIYMTDENSKKYVQEIDDLLEVPFDILSETQSRELQCLKTYKDIREISRTHGAATAELHIIKHLKHFVDGYVELRCPIFSDLESIKKNLKGYSIVTIPQNAYVEGGQHLNPQEITVVLGINSTVTWINEDDVSHGIVSDDSKHNWSSKGIFKPGESFSVTFNKTGIFGYYGQPHPSMTGKVIVLEE
jgi:plastocyanin